MTPDEEAFQREFERIERILATTTEAEVEVFFRSFDLEIERHRDIRDMSRFERTVRQASDWLAGVVREARK